MKFKDLIIRNIKNIPGAKTKRKLVIIFSDDYGSVRVKNKEAYNKLLELGIALNKTRYGYDTLCTTEDLLMLFDVLTSVKDIYGNHACITPFVNIANPDFERIKRSGFQQYHRESFIKTMERLGSDYDGAYELWKQGIAANILYPEYHGTEHINVKKLMRALQKGHKSTLLSFENESVASPFLEGEEKIDNLTAVFDIVSATDNEALEKDIDIGLNMFEDILGFRPTQFTPGAGIYSPSLHKHLMECGITDIHVNRYKAYPLGDGIYSKKFLFLGKKNEFGQHYIVRNCPFEPFFDNRSRNKDVVNNCLKNIESAFRWNVPAMISTHRVNFAGAIEATHRNQSLKDLAMLLKGIKKQWPDVEFISGYEMARILFD